MAIYRLLQNSAFEPETVEMMSSAFEDVCRALGLAERSDPLRDTVAKRVIGIMQQGERDPARLRERTLEALKGDGISEFVGAAQTSQH